jgi:RimJ/RimL family protein N-acetyltransferase
VIQGDRIELRPLSTDILPLVEGWYNDFETTRTLGVDWHPITTRRKLRHLEALLESPDPHFVILDRASGSIIGLCGLDDVDSDSRTAEFSIMIGDKRFRGSGYGTEVTRLLLAYAFDVLGLHNVWLQVSSNNPEAIRAYEKAGFRRIGIRRESVRIGRLLIDDVYMDAIAPDFPPSSLHALMHPDPATSTGPDSQHPPFVTPTGTKR